LSKRAWQFASVLVDILFINISIVLAFLLRFGGELPVFNFQAYTNLAVFITLIQIVFLYVYDLYKAERNEGFSSILTSIMQAVTLGTIFMASLTFFVRFFSFPRLVFLVSWVLMIVFLTTWRILGAYAFRVNWPEQRILVVGTGDLAKQVVSELQHRSEWGYRVIGAIGRQTDQIGRLVAGTKIVGALTDIVPIIKDSRIDRVIVTTPIRQRELLEDLARSAESEVKVEIVPDLYEILIGRVDYTLLSDIPLIEVTKDPVPGWVSITKTVGDKVAAILLLILASPIMLVFGVLMKLTSPGPIFFSQERVGKGTKNFKVYKFRTMISDAEAKTGPVLATADDTRITPLGGFMRRYRIDELPQLFNVLSGSMSFVGPRPERPFFVAQFTEEIPGYSERFRVKPGLTGLAQVSGSYATTAENKLKYDLIYIYHQSVFLDLKIIFSTIKVVLTASGSR
jgi:exopolysaccharide biosynthesis polyprenyl glycosylphosphotransferase